MTIVVFHDHAPAILPDAVEVFIDLQRPTDDLREAFSLSARLQPLKAVAHPRGDREVQTNPLFFS